MVDKISTIYHHLPGLGQSGEPVPALGGQIAPFGFTELEQLDEDWARENQFDRRSTVWVASSPRTLGSADVDAAQECARLVRLAAVAVCGEPLPDPALSIVYAKSQGRVVRQIGPFERTWLLGDRTMATPTPSQWSNIARSCEMWRAARLSSMHPVFLPMQAYGAVYASLAHEPALMVMPVVVALEGVFAPGKGAGIVARMTSNLARVLPRVADIEQRLRKIYKIRSDIIHGRRYDPEAAQAALRVAGRLACLATGALASQIAAKGSDDPQSLYGSWD